MKVNNIQNTNFQSKQRKCIIVSDNMKEEIQKLMHTMNHDTKYEQSTNGNCFKSQILCALKIGKEALFTDKRFLCAPTEKQFVYDHSDCMLEFGHNKIEINSQTGEAYAGRKPFWKSLKQLITQGQMHISNALKNYDNPAIVEKRTLSIAGVTTKGAEIIESAKKKCGLG